MREPSGLQFAISGILTLAIALLAAMTRAFEIRQILGPVLVSIVAEKRLC